MQEMVSMGIGSKPFMDIKPSDAAISDRAIDYIMKGTGELLFDFRVSLRNDRRPPSCSQNPLLLHSPGGQAEAPWKGFIHKF